MRNLPFVFWVIVYPVSWRFGDYLLFLEGKKYSLVIETIATLINLTIWIYVGYLTYEKKKWND